MAKLTKHARGFIHDVVSYIQKEKHVHNDQAIGGLRKLFSKVSKDAEDDVTARVYSAVPLTIAEKSLIKQALIKISGRDIALVSAVKPSLLGGMKIQIRDWVVDMTFLKTLQNMSHILME